MKASKTAIAVALSSVFLFGCDFDVGSENSTQAPGAGGPGAGGPGGGGGETTPGVNYFAQILDSTVADTGQLRVKFSESKSDTAVDNIAEGFLTVNLTYQDFEGITDGTAENAYIQLHTTTGTSNKDLRSELVLGGGNVKYRYYDPSAKEGQGDYVLSDTIGTYTIGEELKVTVAWTSNDITYTINDNKLGTFAAINTAPVEYITLKLGDSKGKSNYELLADDLKIYAGNESENELIFEDDFDSYGLGHDLNEVRYNRAVDVMILSDELNNGGDDNEGDGNDGDDNDGDNNEDGTAVEALNALIDSANVGDTITLSADLDYSTGVINLNKEVTLDGQNVATITGSACIQITAPGAAVTNLAFENSAIGKECGAHDSDSRRGAITVEELASDEDKPVLLTNLTFDGSKVTEDSLYKKASWVFSSGHVKLANSHFTNLQSSLQNNAFYTSCVSASRKGIEINNNTFEIDSLGDKETAAIKVGNSSSGKQSSTNCDVTISGNEFKGYNDTITADVSKDNIIDNEERVVAIFATDAAVNNEDGSVASGNIFN